MRTLTTDFSDGLDPRWQRLIRGRGSLERVPNRLRFVNAGSSSSEYTNAQIDDYQGLPRRRFPWRAPLELTVRARFSHGAQQLSGTAGFGFWNDPLLMTERRIPTLPRALWFFYSSPPSDMKLDADTPGWGWKAATIDALRPLGLLLAPFAMPAALLMNVPPIYAFLWPRIQHALNVRESGLGTSMTEWHTYGIRWGKRETSFWLDGEAVLEAAPSPGGRLGFVMWLDNQYLVVKPWGRFGWGLLEEPARQWMEVDGLRIEPGSGGGLT